MSRLDDYRPVDDLPRSVRGGTPFDLTDFVATSLLKRALRAAGLHHALAGAPCIFVVAGVPDGALSVLTDAVENLFRRSGRDPNCVRSKVHDRTGTKADRTKSVDVAVPSLQAHRSTCWLYDTRDDVPAFLATVVDGVAVIPVPDERLLRAMASRVRAIEPMNGRDLERVMSVPWHLLTSFVEGGRSFRAAAELAGRIEAARSTEPTGQEKAAGPEKNSETGSEVVGVPDGPTLDELPGLGEAAEWGRTLAVDLADYRAGRIGWGEVDRGALLHGPPGTGKTTFALALGRTCGVPVHVHSLARWQAAGYLNALLKAMRTAFSEALAAAPCILFVDELDSFGDRANVDDHNARYTREVINGFLECLDGADGRPGVVVVGATNHPHLIDPAIRRAGRLDREIAIPLPDADARERILRFHLRNDLPGAELAEVAEAMDGKSGADIEALVRGGRRTARMARRPMEHGDLVRALPPAVRLTDAAFRRICIHEAGHVVVGQAFAAASGSVPVRAAVRRELRGPNGNRTEFTLERGGEGTLASYLHLVTTMLGGTAAELEVFGESSELSGGAADSDLARATKLVARIELDLGLGGTLATTGTTSDDEVARCLRQDRAFRRRVERTLTECLERARGFVSERRTDLEAVAKCLEVHGVWHAASGRHALPAAPIEAAAAGKPAARRSDRRQGLPRAVPG